MSRVVVDQLLSMLDQGFEPPPKASPTDGWHSLTSNLEGVRDEDWNWVPTDGRRTICALAIHCGFAMRMYADHGFGEATLQMSDAVYPSGGTAPTKGGVLPWLRQSYQMLRNGLDSRNDSDLADVRATHWGENKTRRWFIVTMIEHNLYHSGEINHIRALAQRNDRW